MTNENCQMTNGKRNLRNLWIAFHSYLSATSGSIRVALRAGTYAATTATPSITKPASINETGSVGDKSNNSVDANRATTTTAGRPATIPITTSTSASRSTS